MATLAEQRRASGERAVAERRASDPTAERRQGGRDMVERRTGKSEAEDLNALIKPPRARRSLPALEPRGALPPQRGRGNYVPPPAGTGGGLAWPLTEDSAEARVYWPNKIISSADGLIAIRVKPIKTLVLRDANDSSGNVDLAQP